METLEPGCLGSVSLSNTGHLCYPSSEEGESSMMWEEDGVRGNLLWEVTLELSGCKREER